MRRILLTNEDGIASDGLIRLAREAKRFGEVWIVAPHSQRSAASHCITLHDTIDIIPYDYPVDGVRAFSCSGMPADCIRVGALSVMPALPEVVISGINYGYNVASDVQYSGTVGAAFEAAFQGICGIALSECDKGHEVTDQMLGAILKELMGKTPAPGHIFNVNFPGCSMEEYRGILYDRTVSRGMIYKDHYNLVGNLEGGGTRWMVEGVYNEEAEEGSDYRALLDGYISISEIRNLGY